PKSLGLTDAAWAQQKSGIQGSLHTTLGSIAFNKKDYDKSIEELTASTKLVPNDGTSWYYLGFSYYMQNQAMAKQALEAIDQTNAQIRSRADKALIDESRATADALQDAAREKQDKALD